MQPKRRSIGILLCVMLAGLGLAAACGSSTPTATPSASSNSTSQAQIADLQKQLDEVRANATVLESQLSDTRQTLDTRTAMLEGLLNEAKQRDQTVTQNQDVQKRYSALKDIAGSLDSDRQLLIELRKNPPDPATDDSVTLQQLQDYWQNVKTLALKSDPALGRMADRVIAAANVYADWAVKDYASQNEASQAYFTTGANQYSQSIDALNKAALLVVIFRMDGIIQQTQS